MLIFKPQNRSLQTQAIFIRGVLSIFIYALIVL